MRAGFEPIELFQESSVPFWRRDPQGLKAFYDYRRDENTRLLKGFFDALTKVQIQGKRQWDIVVTVLDALQHPELSDYLGIDMERTISIINHEHATLQVEDPASDWPKAP